MALLNIFFINTYTFNTFIFLWFICCTRLSECDFLKDSPAFYVSGSRRRLLGDQASLYHSQKYSARLPDPKFKPRQIGIIYWNKFYGTFGGKFEVFIYRILRVGTGIVIYCSAFRAVNDSNSGADICRKDARMFELKTDCERVSLLFERSTVVFNL